MKALGVTATGNSAQIKSLTVPVPSINADDLLVKVSAFSLNPVRLHILFETLHS